MSRDELITLVGGQAQRMATQDARIAAQDAQITALATRAAELMQASEDLADRLGPAGASVVAELAELVQPTVQGRRAGRAGAAAEVQACRRRADPHGGNTPGQSGHGTPPEVNRDSTRT